MSLVSKTVSALEKRLTVSEDKMSNVIDHLRSVDTSGRERQFNTETVIQTSTMIKEMDPTTLTRNLEAEQQKRDDVKVNPIDQVDEDFLRSTN